jgi:methionine aminopeptidase
VLKYLKTAPRDYVAKLVSIVTTRKCVPFHPDWYNLTDELVMGGIKNEYWKPYPAIKTADDAPAVQWEKMILVTDSVSKLLV